MLTWPCCICREFLRAFFMQLAVLSNHQNGRDTHIRQIKIYGPRQYVLYPESTLFQLVILSKLVCNWHKSRFLLFMGGWKLFEVSKLWTIDFLVNSFSQWSCDRAGWQWLGTPLSLLQWSSVRAPLSVSVTTTLCKSFFSICLRFAWAFTSFWDLLQGQQGYLMYLCSWHCI